MATYYPEGECFFKRSTLRYLDQFNADDPESFYNHVLVEYHWNKWVVSSTNVKGYTHARSKLKTGKADWPTWDTTFGVWDRFWVGESKERSPGVLLAKTGYGQNDNYNELRNVDQGGPLKYILRPIRIQSKDTKWLWIDATIPLRAIYFPVCQSCDEAFPDYCTYVVIDFRARDIVDISNLQGEYAPYKCYPSTGLGYVQNITWGFNIPGIISYLVLPRQFRNPNRGVYRSEPKGEELMVRADTYEAWNCSNPDMIRAFDGFSRNIDLAVVISATFGVEVGWRPYQYSSFALGMLQTLVQFGISFIPCVGPLLSWGLGMGLQVMEDPDSFSEDNILGLTDAILGALVDSALRSKGGKADGVLPKVGGGKSKTSRKIGAPTQAQKEEGDRINAELSKAIRKRIGETPPQSSVWLSRISNDQDGEKSDPVLSMKERTGGKPIESN